MRVILPIHRLACGSLGQARKKIYCTSKKVYNILYCIDYWTIVVKRILYCNKYWLFKGTNSIAMYWFLEIPFFYSLKPSINNFL